MADGALGDLASYGLTGNERLCRVTPVTHHAVPGKRRNVNICRARSACVSAIHRLVMNDWPYIMAVQVRSEADERSHHQ